MLKKLDGSEYVLTRPNPLAMTQEPMEEVILHNLNGLKETKTFPDMPKKTAIVKKPIIFEPVETAIVKEPDPLPEPIIPEPVKIIENVEKKHTSVISIHCLPAEMKIVKDELYGDTYSKVKYGNKFVFEGVVVESQDLRIKIWSNSVLSEKSVIYPSHYIDSGQKFGDFRWWKINKSEPAPEGFFYEAVISDYQPDFSLQQS